ncbi:MAG TPA: 3-phosphoshikimate 1-carboxyvinyltransferase [Oscillospiraceae bacterium]|nr:3-phosphoshikimate 1-carboxyvinyltransferase [Oscillospiraceae bacterium]HPS35949.1 3-phosphoshikimate 1-carboxyvinyltransferase [Oscillospiraceae bacterium]
MNMTITPALLSGTVAAIPSKSHLHRLLICAALSDTEIRLPCSMLSQDIEATVRCLNALGAKVEYINDELLIRPIKSSAKKVTLDCGESGSLYRFLVPLVGALRKTATFQLSAKLPQRPMDALWNTLETHGIMITGKGTANPIVSGTLTPGRYEIPGDVSSQFISGLLFALPLLSGDSEIIVTGQTQSVGYIQMTLDALTAFSIKVTPTATGYFVQGNQHYHAVNAPVPEGDWSNSAFWLCASAANAAGACSGEITVTGLNLNSGQGDKAVCDILRQFGAAVTQTENAVTVRKGNLRGITIDAADVPDLVPALAVVAAAATGTTVIQNISRLRLKESDRVATVCGLINALGGNAAADENTMTITGSGILTGGTYDAYQDHRIVMAAAIASTICKNPVTVTNAQNVDKSYPEFFNDFSRLNGICRERS